MNGVIYSNFFKDGPVDFWMGYGIEDLPLARVCHHNISHYFPVKGTVIPDNIGTKGITNFLQRGSSRLNDLSGNNVSINDMGAEFPKHS